MTLLLLSVTARQAASIGVALREGRAKGEDLAAELWADYAGQRTSCFLCDVPVVLPCFTQIIPDKRPGTSMAVPL
jgi:hypothetical protein